METTVNHLSTANAPAYPPHPAGEEGKLSEVVLVTIPAALAYFIGWAYLHYYLAEFGIGISELDLGLETIFIYSAPPTVWVVRSHGWALLIWIVFALVTVVAISALWQNLPIWLTSPLKKAARFYSTLSSIAKGLVAFVLLMAVLLLLSPLIKASAIARASEKWDRVGVLIQATVDEPEHASSQYRDYVTCSERKGLDLIFADRNGYFMLCLSEIDEASAAVFEVRRDDATLASVRAVSRRN